MKLRPSTAGLLLQ